MFARSWVLAVALSLALAGCKKDEPAPAPVAAKPVAEPAAPVKVVDTSVTSISGQSDPECIGPIDLAVPKDVSIGALKAKRDGYKLSFTASEKKDSPTVFGVVACINEDSGENLVNLKKYVEFFKAEKADAIIVVGDTGDEVPSIVRSLGPLADTGLPLFVAIGNRECKGDFKDALVELEKAHSNVVNLGWVRHVEFGNVDLISLPGYHDKRYLHCATGCQYFKQDVDALKPLAKGSKNPVVLVSHGPPHGSTPMSIDAAMAGNVGDANLNALISEAGIPFGVFANIKEAGARATDLAGANVIKEDVLADKLYLNPGPADSVAWAMNDGTQSVGTVATLTVQGRQAKYKIFRAKPLTADEKAQAAKLAPAPAKEEPAVPAKKDEPKKDAAPKK
jgi:Icc-related predicted phosphoesterase